MNEERYILFDKYLNNELNFEEKESLENDLKSNPEMAESLEIYKDLNGYLKNKFENESSLNNFKENLKNAASANEQKITTKIFSIKPIYYAVAACFALIFGIMFFNNNNKTPTYIDYFEQQKANFADMPTAKIDYRYNNLHPDEGF